MRRVVCNQLPSGNACIARYKRVGMNAAEKLYEDQAFSSADPYFWECGNTLHHDGFAPEKIEKRTAAIRKDVSRMEARLPDPYSIPMAQLKGIIKKARTNFVKLCARPTAVLVV